MKFGRFAKIVTVLFLIIALVISLAYVFFQVSKSRTFQLFGTLVSQVETTEKAVALTFDDGPTSGITDKILQLLAERNVKATFYLIGEALENDMADGVKIAAAGHEIGNHTYSHVRMIFKTYGRIQRELETTDTLIRQTGYSGDITFRAPYCKKLFLLPLYLATERRISVTWNLEPDSIASLADDTDKMLRYVAEKIVPGSIILLHAMYENRGSSLNLIGPLIDMLKSRGYRFLTVSELLKLGENQEKSLSSSP